MNAKRITQFVNGRQNELNVIKIYSNMPQTNKPSKPNSEYFTKSPANTNVTIGRANSLVKKSGRILKIASNPYINNKIFESTYYGQGFNIQAKAKIKENCREPSCKVRMSSMHKTATFWNICSNEQSQVDLAKKKIDGLSLHRKSNGSRNGGLLIKENVKALKLSRKPSFRNERIGGAVCLPSIEYRGRTNNLWQDKSAAKLEDRYINFIAENKKVNRDSQLLVIKKETEVGQINGCNENPKLGGNTNTEETEDKPKSVRTFNWEGIHFEVSPRIEGSPNRAEDLKSNYSSDINLMSYNFNGSSNRNHADSPSTDFAAESSKIRKKFINRASMNNLPKERSCTNNTTSSTLTNNTEDRTEKVPFGKSSKNSGLDESSNAEENQSQLKDCEPPTQKIPRPPSPIANKCYFP
jgi:hypothetical protein